MTKIYVLANQKGGVGKTTTAVNVGAYLAAEGQRSLVVDADPQANATSSLGVDKRNVSLSVYDSLIRKVPLARIVIPTSQQRLALVPSTPDLAGAEVEMVGLLAREHLLYKALAPVADSYDFIFIDCPPSLGLLTVNGLAAATSGVIIPLQCEYLALEGLSQLIKTLNLVRESLNPALKIAGIVMTMFDSRTRLAQQVVDDVRAHFGRRVFATVIPRNVRLSEAPSYGQPILSYDPRCAGALAYQALAREVLEMG